MALTLSLLLLGAIITMFGKISESISDSRSMLESADRLRLAQERLRQDLAGVTVTMSPPRDPANNEGYFEYVEGPVGVGIWPMPASNSGYYQYYPNNGVYVMFPSTIAHNSAAGTITMVPSPPNNPPDATVGDFDDMLMFTTRSSGQPFVGKCGGTTIQSNVAEVAWFVRGHTLHRRVLLVAPNAPISTTMAGYYQGNDVSAHVSGGVMVANTLGDLTRRECRFAHPSTTGFPAPLGLSGGFPAVPQGCEYWMWAISGGTVGANQLWFYFPTLPTLSECTGVVSMPSTTPPPPQWSPGQALINAADVAHLGTATNPIAPDFWTNDASQRIGDNAFATVGSRVSDDIVLTNVIGFDVKAWDPHVRIQLTDTGTGAVSFLLPGDPLYGQAYTRAGTTVGTTAYALVSPGAYMDLGYAGINAAVSATPANDSNGAFTAGNANGFGHTGNPRSGLTPALINPTTANLGAPACTTPFRQPATAPLPATGSMITATALSTALWTTTWKRPTSRHIPLLCGAFR